MGERNKGKLIMLDIIGLIVVCFNIFCIFFLILLFFKIYKALSIYIWKNKEYDMFRINRKKDD